jgi:ABC-type Fe3+ transport system substrate-binding protein
MNTTFSKSDRKFLKSAGISVEPSFDEARLALAERIAKHQAPVQVVVDPQAAKRQLIRLATEKLLEASESSETAKIISPKN